MIRAIVITFIVSLPVFITLHFLSVNAAPMKKGIECLVDDRFCK